MKHVRHGLGTVRLYLYGYPPANATHASVYVYVQHVDDVYRNAMEQGEVSLAEPEDKPYGERSADVQDSFGNTWWISTYID